MKKERAKYIQGAWINCFLMNLVSGSIIGVLISLFQWIAKGHVPSVDTIIANLIFSLLITISVTNCIFLAQTIFHLRYEKPVFFILAYVLSALIGSFVGIELSHFVMAKLHHRPYHFFHPMDLLFGSLIVTIVCTICYIYYAQKAALSAKLQEKELEMARLSQLKAQAELATLHSKINPHFLYNALNSIASLIHEDPDKAEDMTLKLSKLFRYSINKNQEDMVLVSEEVDTCMTYLEIERVRFGDRINFQFDVSPDISNYKIPRFLIQPLAENALKHGLNNTTSGGELLVSVKKSGDQLEIVIADNGTPFPAELQTGYGLQSTYDKLSLLYGKNYYVQMQNNPKKQIKISLPATL